MPDKPALPDENGQVPDDAPFRVPFAGFLQKQENGTLHADLGDALAQVVAAVMDTGKAGSLTLKIGIKKSKMDNAVEVEADVKTKMPAIPRSASFWFPDVNNNLHRDDPRQLTFTTVREAPAPPAAVRTPPAAPTNVREVS